MMFIRLIISKNVLELMRVDHIDIFILPAFMSSIKLLYSSDGDLHSPAAIPPEEKIPWQDRGLSQYILIYTGSAASKNIHCKMVPRNTGSHSLRITDCRRHTHLLAPVRL